MPDRSSDWLRLPPALRQQKHSPWVLAGDVLSNRGPWARPLAPLPKPHHAAGPGRCPACPDLLDVQPRAPKDVPMAPAPAVLPQDIQGHSRHMAHADPMHPDFAQAPRHTADTGPMDSAEAWLRMAFAPAEGWGSCPASSHRAGTPAWVRAAAPARPDTSETARHRRGLGLPAPVFDRPHTPYPAAAPRTGVPAGPGTGSAPWDRADHSGWRAHAGRYTIPPWSLRNTG